jgi:hypothetical protein
MNAACDVPPRSRFPTAAHLCSWARLAPGVKESAGKKKGRGSTGHGNPYLARVLGEAAVAAAKTDTFLGERFRRIARRRGRKKAIVAVGRSILVTVWYLLSDPKPGSTTSGLTSTTTGSAPTARSATTSDNSKPSATRSPSNPQPDHRYAYLRPPPSRRTGRGPVRPSPADFRISKETGAMSAPWKFAEKTRARAVSLHADRLRDHWDPRRRTTNFLRMPKAELRVASGGTPRGGVGWSSRLGRPLRPGWEHREQIVGADWEPHPVLNES